MSGRGHERGDGVFQGVSILIAAHNRSGLTLRTLESLSLMIVPQGLAVECIVIANACTDDTEQVVAERARSMPFPTRVVSESRIGVSHARNRAVLESRHDLLLFVDSDVYADERLLLEHLSVYREHGADLVTGRIDLWWDEVQDPGWLTPDMRLALGEHRAGDQSVRLSTPDAYSANLSLKREVADRVGAFRTDIGRMGTRRLAGEETLFADRALELGFALWYAPRAVVKHWVAASSLNDEFFMRSTYHGSASLVLIQRRFGPGRCLKHIATALARLAIGGAEIVGGRLGAGPTRLRVGRCRWATGLGQLAGLWQRLTRGPVR